MRKAGLQFFPTLELDPDTTGLAGTLSLKYKLRGVDTDYTDATGTFSEDAPGVYSLPLTLGTPGDYSVIISSTDAGVSSKAGSVLVTAATIDDVKVLVDGLITTANGMKTQIDLLDETELNTVREAIDSLAGNVASLTEIINSDDSNDAIVSLRELLQDISAAGSNQDAVIAAFNAANIKPFGDLKAMLNGDEFLSDGTTANPLFGKGLDEIFAEIIASKLAVLAAIQGVKTVVDANKALLENSTYGLNALKTALDSGFSLVMTSLDTGFAAVGVDLATKVTEIKTMLTSRFDAVDAKLTVIDGKVAAGNASRVGTIIL